MPFDPFNWRRGLDQGRIQPQTRAVSPEDSPAPAQIVTLTTAPFALADQDDLRITVDGGLLQQVIFDAADFADITKATALEVVAVLTAQLTGVTVDAVGNTVRITSNTEGLTSSLNVSGGTGQSAVQFQTGEITGTQGQWSFVLGHEDAGEVFEFTTGDNCELEQNGLFNDALIWRINGVVQWRSDGNTSPGSWALQFRVDDTTYAEVLDIDQVDPELPSLVDLSDIAINVSGLAAVARDVQVRLIAVTTAGAGTYEQELPAAFFDFVEFDEFAADIELANRYPGPGMQGVTPTLAAAATFDILNTTANALDLTETTVWVNDTIVYQAGSFIGPFSGSTTTVGPASRDVRFSLDFSSLAPFASSEPMVIKVNTQTAGAASTLSDSWAFEMEDTTAPSILAAQAQSKTVVRVTFSEPVLMDTSATGALNTANYTFTPQTLPAVTIDPVSVEQVSDTQVDVTLNWELSLNANYQVAVTQVADLAGNPMSTILNAVTFAAFRPNAPAGRSFQLWDALSPHDRKQDATTATRPLRKFVLCLQDIVDLLLCDIDRWTNIIDIDLAPEPFLNAILRQLGNPFSFLTLTLNQKRRLARILVSIYKQKGTEPGIINAIRFFLGIDVTLDVLNARDYWKIGVHQLSLDTIIGPGEGSPLWYSFYIVSPVILTEEQREQMLKIADYMKPAHEHILGITEPGGVVTPGNFWHIGVDTLGVTTTLGA